MRTLLIMIIAAALVATGCAKKDETGASPSPAATATAEATNQPTAAVSPTASPAATTGAANGGTGGAAATAPALSKEELANLPAITRDQVQNLDPDSTYQDLVKLAGKEGKLVKEEGGKKTYEYKLANETDYYADVTYGTDGKLTGVSMFKQ